jgi:hypothetical protein
MSVLTKYWLALFSWPVIGIPLVVMGANISQWFFICVPILGIFLGTYIDRLKCPHCQNSIASTKKYGIKIYRFPSPQCDRCGCELV